MAIQVISSPGVILDESSPLLWLQPRILMYTFIDQSTIHQTSISSLVYHRCLNNKLAIIVLNLNLLLYYYLDYVMHC